MIEHGLAFCFIFLLGMFAGAWIGFKGACKGFCQLEARGDVKFIGPRWKPE